MDIKQDELAVIISLLMLHNLSDEDYYKDVIDKAFLAANYITEKLEE